MILFNVRSPIRVWFLLRDVVIKENKILILPPQSHNRACCQFCGVYLKNVLAIYPLNRDFYRTCVQDMMCDYLKARASVGGPSLHDSLNRVLWLPSSLLIELQCDQQKCTLTDRESQHGGEVSKLIWFKSLTDLIPVILTVREPQVWRTWLILFQWNFLKQCFDLDPKLRVLQLHK